MLIAMARIEASRLVAIMRWIAAGAVLVLAACARRAAPPALSPEPPGAGLTVTLGWGEAVDLDLYVTDPTLETAYYANARTRSGGTFGRDARCADRAAGARVETVVWTDPPPGRYRVGVDFPEGCGGRATEADYRLRIDLAGERRETTGRARLIEREPQVLEFIVPTREGRP